jgi:hypothetical protein
MNHMPLTFTHLDLKPVLDPLFDKCITTLTTTGPDRQAKVRDAYRTMAKTEIFEQGKTYTAEENAFVALVTNSYRTAQMYSKSIGVLTNELATVGWDDAKFAQITDMRDKISQLAKDVHDSRRNATAHQGWRAGGWDETKATQAFGEAGQQELNESYLRIRKPMVDAMGSVKTLSDKLDEYEKRGEDSVKTAQALKPRQRIDLTQFTKSVQDLLDGAKNNGKWQGDAARQNGLMRDFVKLVSKDKKKVDAAKLKAAEGYQSAAEIWLGKSKATVKTLQVKVDNAKLVLPKSVSPPVQPPLLKSLKEASDELDAARAAIKSVEDQSKIHKQKIEEAKARK